MPTIAAANAVGVCSWANGHAVVIGARPSEMTTYLNSLPQYLRDPPEETRELVLIDRKV